MRIINKKLMENTAMGICVAGALYISGFGCERCN